VHCRSAAELGEALTKLPAPQARQGSQLAALFCALNEPLGHDVHVRSVVELPSSATSWPATHSVHGTQAVAGSPS